MGQIRHSMLKMSLKTHERMPEVDVSMELSVSYSEGLSS
jgi:hypothetical protein